MKLIAITSYMLIMVIFSIVEAGESVSYEKCWSDRYGECSESLCWDYDAEIAEKDMKCDKFAAMYCKGEISERKFNLYVEELKIVRKEVK